MAGRQRTFELIPTTLVKSNDDVPVRMTSKAVKKAYQQKNRGPRISKAEQRRLDAEELSRQKKEWEREKAAAKAKAVREKKAAKENAEKEARKKMGMPEPSRFVRASQPTISRFVRGNTSGKRSWQDMKMDTVAEDSDDTMPGEGEKDKAVPPTKRLAVDVDSEDEFGEFPSLSQSDLLEKIDSSMLSVNGGDSVCASPSNRPPHRPPSPELPTRKPSEDEYPWDDSQAIADLANTQLLSEAAEAAKKSDSPRFKASSILHRTVQIPTAPRKSSPLAVRPTSEFQGQTNVRKPVIGPRSPLQELSVNMPPPPLPLKEKRAISLAPTPHKPNLLSRNSIKTNNNLLHSIPPSATQSFLKNHFDDFFPSPTQEIRELLCDANELPSNTQIARELSPEIPLETLNEIPSHEPITKGFNLLKAVEEDQFDDLICTQDLILSSQDLSEITTPSRVPAKAVISPLTLKHPQGPSSRPRFFEEKEEDVLHAVLEESMKAPAVAEAPTRAQERKRTFFEEKEDDLLAAAIYESKMMAQREFSFGREVKDAAKAVNAGERKERTLKRVTSTATTDYGEDDFSGGELEELGF